MTLRYPSALAVSSFALTVSLVAAGIATGEYFHGRGAPLTYSVILGLATVVVITLATVCVVRLAVRAFTRDGEEVPVALAVGLRERPGQLYLINAFVCAASVLISTWSIVWMLAA